MGKNNYTAGYVFKNSLTKKLNSYNQNNVNDGNGNQTVETPTTVAKDVFKNSAIQRLNFYHQNNVNELNAIKNGEAQQKQYCIRRMGIFYLNPQNLSRKKLCFDTQNGTKLITKTGIVTSA